MITLKMNIVNINKWAKIMSHNDYTLTTSMGEYTMKNLEDLLPHTEGYNLLINNVETTVVELSSVVTYINNGGIMDHIVVGGCTNIFDAHSLVKEYPIHIDWRHGFGNQPNLVQEDFMTEFYQFFGDDYIEWDHRVLGGTIYLLAEVVTGKFIFKAFADESALGPRGYGGNPQTAQLIGGEMLESTNCWSSNAAAINTIFERTGDEALVEVGGHSITRDVARAACKGLGYHLVESRPNCFVPSADKYKVQKAPK